MGNEFASSKLTVGQLNAIVKKLGGHEGAMKFLRGELVVPEPARAWREEDDVIRFSVTSDGTTGKEWIARLEKKGFRVSDCAKSVLRSKKFRLTSNKTTEIAVLKGTLFSDDNRVTAKIRAEAKRRGLSTPNPEIICLIREKCSDKDLEDMGLYWIVAMYESYEDSDGDPCLLGANRNDFGRRLDALGDRPDDWWRCDDGFVFVIPQASR